MEKLTMPLVQLFQHFISHLQAKEWAFFNFQVKLEQNKMDVNCPVTDGLIASKIKENFLG